MSLQSWIQWFRRKDDNQHLFAAFFHISAITLVSMSMVGLPWFSLTGDVCLPQLTLGQFFWFDSFFSDRKPEEMECISPFLISMMRVIIILCLLVILLSLGGFFMDILTSKNTINRVFLKYAIPGTCIGSVILIMIIISISCYVVLILEDSLTKMFPKIDTDVTYGPGFYFVSSAGVVLLFGMYYTLNMVQDSGNYCTDDDQCLIDAFDEGTPSQFTYVTPPPPYNIPPPPYTP